MLLLWRDTENDVDDKDWNKQNLSCVGICCVNDLIIW